MLGMATDIIFAAIMLWAGYVGGRIVQFRSAVGRWPRWTWIAQVATSIRPPKE